MAKLDFELVEPGEEIKEALRFERGLVLFTVLDCLVADVLAFVLFVNWDRVDVEFEDIVALGADEPSKTFLLFDLRMFKCFFNVPPAVLLRAVTFSDVFVCLADVVTFLTGLDSFLTCEFPFLEASSFLSITRIDKDDNELSVIEDELDKEVSGNVCMLEVFVNDREMLPVVTNELFEVGHSRILLVVIKVLDEIDPVILSWVRLL